MKPMMTVLLNEKARLENEIKTIKNQETEKLENLEKQLEIVISDIERLEMYIDRPDMQTWSELLFVDDIKQRVERIQSQMFDL